MNVVITGASRGIGLELTRLALQSGAQVLAVARNGLPSELTEAHREKLREHKADVSKPDFAVGVREALSSWSHVDLLFNNAGVYRKGVAPEDFRDSFHVNTLAPLFLTQELLPMLRKSSDPKVVHTTSLMGSITDNSSGGSYAYRASKTALNMLNKCLSVDQDWLTCLVLHPGWVKTEMGGSGAPTEVAESARGLWDVVRKATREQSGRFYDFRGKALPW